MEEDVNSKGILNLQLEWQGGDGVRTHSARRDGKRRTWTQEGRLLFEKLLPERRKMSE